MAIRVLATADLHLGKRSSGISISKDDFSTKEAWYRIVDWAIVNQIDVVLLSGDIVDRNNKYYEAIGPLQAGFEKLGNQGIQIYMVAGNHDFDVLPQIVKQGQYSHVHMLGRNGQWELAKFIKNGDILQIAGWSFPRRFVRDNPLVSIDTIDIDPNYPSIGLLHGDIDNPESYYNPIRSNDLTTTPITAWLLGHIHKPMMAEVSGTSIFYPGSPQALSAKESGMHGFLELTVINDRSIQLNPIAISTVRYDKLTIDISKATMEEELRTELHLALNEDVQRKLPELESVLYIVYDIHLIGEHSNEMLIFQLAEQIKNDYEIQIASGSKLSVRSITSSIQPTVENLDELSREPTPAGMLAGVILAIQERRSIPFLDDLTSEWRKAFRELQSSGVYQPLQIKWQEEKPHFDSNDFILQESRRLLSQLLLQTNQF